MCGLRTRSACADPPSGGTQQTQSQVCRHVVCFSLGGGAPTARSPLPRVRLARRVLIPTPHLTLVKIPCAGGPVCSALALSGTSRAESLRNSLQEEREDLTTFQVTIFIILLILTVVIVLLHFVEAWKVLPGAHLISGVGVPRIEASTEYTLARVRPRGSIRQRSGCGGGLLERRSKQAESKAESTCIQERLCNTD